MTEERDLMGLTRAEAKARGIVIPEELWPKPGSGPKLPEAEPPPSRHVEDGMNKLERAFWERLQQAWRGGIFATVQREPIKLRLAGNTFYTPDFMTVSAFGQTQVRLWETKGFMRDDAAVKLKVAAAQYPLFGWVLVQRDRGKWRCISVTRLGFGREEWCPDWLS